MMFYTRKFLWFFGFSIPSLPVLSEMYVKKVEALTRVCTGVANLDMDQRKDEMALIKENEDILYFQR
jgi:hypothetical protein